MASPPAPSDASSVGPACAVIMACVVKSRRDADLGLVYARAAVRRGLVDELHVWCADAELGRELVAPPGRGEVRMNGYVYSTLKGAKLRAGAAGALDLEFSAPDTQVLLHDVSDGRVYAEVVLGGWGNSVCALRRVPQGQILQSLPIGVDPSGGNVARFELCDETGDLRIQINGNADATLTDKLPPGTLACDVGVCTWDRPGTVHFGRALNENSELLVDWDGTVAAIAAHYAAQKRTDTALVIAQDLAFVDLDGLERFTSHLRSGQNVGTVFTPFVLGDAASARAFKFDTDIEKFSEDPVAFVEAFESECFGVTTLKAPHAPVPHTMRALYLRPNDPAAVQRVISVNEADALEEGDTVTVTAYSFAIRADGDRLKDEATLRKYVDIAARSAGTQDSR